MRGNGSSVIRLRVARALAVLAVAMILVFGPGCSKGESPGGAQPRPSSPANLKILSPTNGEVVRGTDVEIKVDLTGARIVQATTTNISPDGGHLHVYLDNQLVSMNFSTTQDVGNIKPGMHVLRVEFVAADHRPFDPRVFTAVTFEVES
jgi:hypothetical protein